MNGVGEREAGRALTKELVSGAVRLAPNVLFQLAWCSWFQTAARFAGVTKGCQRCPINSGTTRERNNGRARSPRPVTVGGWHGRIWRALSKALPSHLLFGAAVFGRSAEGRGRHA